MFWVDTKTCYKYSIMDKKKVQKELGTLIFTKYMIQNSGVIE